MPTTFEPSRAWRILHATARRHFWQGEGWLSIKSFSGGSAHYSVGAGHHAVDDHSYLIVNHGRNYTIDIASRQPIESFCIFFAPNFAADVFRNHTASEDQLLIAPEGDSQPVDFFEKIYPHDKLVSPLLRRLKNQNSGDSGLLEEQLHGILRALLAVHGHTLREASRLKSVRVATRIELFRRTARARDYADAMFAQPLSLNDMARVAALSPNHLLRTFAQVYQQTPHEFLTARRVDEAKTLLRNSELSITEICFAVGFQSPGSFSALFKKRIGLSPTEFRALKR